MSKKRGALEGGFRLGATADDARRFLLSKVTSAAGLVVTTRRRYVGKSEQGAPRAVIETTPSKVLVIVHQLMSGEEEILELPKEGARVEVRLLRSERQDAPRVRFQAPKGEAVTLYEKKGVASRHESYLVAI